MAGWTPRVGEVRQKAFRRANLRASTFRRSLTQTEARFWRMLRLFNRDNGSHVRRQIALQDRIFDFGDYGARVLIEIDGGVHRLPAVAERDAEKTLLAVYEGFRVLRLTNQEVWGSEDAGYSKVRAFLAASLP